MQALAHIENHDPLFRAPSRPFPGSTDRSTSPRTPGTRLRRPGLEPFRFRLDDQAVCGQWKILRIQPAEMMLVIPPCWHGIFACDCLIPSPAGIRFPDIRLSILDLIPVFTLQ